MHFIRVQVVQPYSSTVTETAWKKSFILYERQYFHMIDSSSPRLSHAYVYITFSRGDIAAKVYELVD